MRGETKTLVFYDDATFMENDMDEALEDELYESDPYNRTTMGTLDNYLKLLNDVLFIFGNNCGCWYTMSEEMGDTKKKCVICRIKDELGE